MSVNSWTPGEAAKTLPNEAIDALIALAEQAQEGATWPEIPEDLAQYDWVMRQNLAFWQQQLSNRDQPQLEALLKTFTLAEDHWPSWAGNDKSPVIHIFKILRKDRGIEVDKSLIQWIKSHTKNRFLPYGPLL